MRADQVIRTVNAEWSVWKVIGKSSGLTAVIEVNLGPVNDLAVGRGGLHGGEEGAQPAVSAVRSNHLLRGQARRERGECQ